LRFSQQWLCRVLPSGIECHAVHWKFSETSVVFQQTIQHYIPEDRTLSYKLPILLTKYKEKFSYNLMWNCSFNGPKQNLLNNFKSVRIFIWHMVDNALKKIIWKWTHKELVKSNNQTIFVHFNLLIYFIYTLFNNSH
jgi:hypothetical protein